MGGQDTRNRVRRNWASKVETLSYGRHPNCFRIYDKISELHHQYSRILCNASDAAEVPTFEEKYNYPAAGFFSFALSGNLRASGFMSSLNALIRCGNHVNTSFDWLELNVGGALAPDINDYEPMEYATGLELRTVAID